MVAHTVTSVGPYAFTIRPTTGCQRRTRSGGHASPPTTNVSIDTGSGTVAATEGGINACVIAWSASRSRNCSPTTGPGGATTNVAPTANAINSSITIASKPGDDNCNTRDPAVSPKHST